MSRAELKPPATPLQVRHDRVEKARRAALERRLAEQAETIASLTEQVAEREARIAGLLSSRSWRLTSPLRAMRSRPRPSGLLPLLRQTAEVARRTVLGRSVDGGTDGLDNAARFAAAYAAPTGTSAAHIVAPSVVIIAELSLAQCAKYRVWQKQEMLDRLGVPCTVVEWWKRDAVIEALQTHAVAIFYRVPGYPVTLANIAEAKRLGVPTFWEVDDLIFDIALYETNPNIAHLNPALRQSVLDGVPLFRASLLACDHGIASTPVLADAMRTAGQSSVFVIENGIDTATLTAVDTILAQPAPTIRSECDDSVTIVYGSGSKAHTADFAAAGGAIGAVMRARPNVRLRLIGDLDLPPALADMKDRVIRLPSVDYAGYLRLLAEAEINIAPVAPCAFNDAKSNTKFIEASLLGLPSVCSPRDSFKAVIRHGANGFLAETAAEWEASLLALVDDPALRHTVAAAADATVRDRYGPDSIIARNVRPFLDCFSPTAEREMRVLVVNTFFSPQSFGGATVVAEQMATRLAARPGMNAAVFTSCGDGQAKPYSLTRFSAGALPVFAVRMPDGLTPSLEYHNARMTNVFASVLDAWRPDVVHLHSIQGLSASIIKACQERGIPYVVTLHDAWWICERQFMVRPDGRYCFQRTIDFAVCATCVPDLGFTIRRSDFLRPLLDSAALLLTPSAFHRDLHVANGFDPDRIVVNKNGVRVPNVPPRDKTPRARVRFGFVGGTGPLKGLDLIRAAFAGIARTDWELILVDNTLNLGFSSLQVDDWSLPGVVRTIPAYTQDSMDAFFEGLDVLLFPSQWKESFGLPVREAQARNVWVIVTEAGGAAEDVVDGVNGRIIPMGADPAPLRAAIDETLVRRSMFQGYVNPHRDSITTIDAQAAELGDLLEGVVIDHAERHTDTTHVAAD